MDSLLMESIEVMWLDLSSLELNNETRWHRKVIMCLPEYSFQ